MVRGEKNKRRTDKKKERMNNRVKTMTHNSYSDQAQTEATGRGHVSYLLCPDPRCKRYLDENVALLLQAREVEKKKPNQIR